MLGLWGVACIWQHRLQAHQHDMLILSVKQKVLGQVLPVISLSTVQKGNALVISFVSVKISLFLSFFLFFFGWQKYKNIPNLEQTMKQKLLETSLTAVEFFIFCLICPGTSMKCLHRVCVQELCPALSPTPPPPAPVDQYHLVGTTQQFKSTVSLI